ncbi:DNA-directed RNA polymerase III subunit-like protein [Emericellopsis cladophorae]|uniref:DNA-directed RNA polymerase III subunit-like protein n=1 Tax=Emericellopsis cladophorae TaxID=2686198 RepID=A0A9P9Y4I8_9HYPO|nr:DNA-directed RNA polymerase III subunit-like protein [Emericellopsis cladophorae]KAI6782804.1 DNA-directed RNA polymerase III subunit-like protein [Emericellopsis cladophorae]
MAKPVDFAKMDVDPPQDEDDPITATYSVFLNPALPAGRRLLVLQQPNRTDSQHPRAPPTELRLKSHAGMVEVDVPLSSDPVVYDREKGQRWGRSLHQSTQMKSGGSHGLAGGFGFGAVQQKQGGRKKQEEDDNELMMDWNEAVRQGKALTTQTLGGQYPDTNEVQYMVGVFQGQNLHITPVSSLVHLRPQLHHIDATTHLEKRAAGEASGTAGAGGAGAGAAGAAGGAKAIHMTIKTTTDGEVATTETMADRLRAVQSEPWRKLRYTDENEEAAWDVYNESLFLQNPASGESPADGQEAEAVDKGKKKESASEEDEVEAKKAAVPEEPKLAEHVPHFSTKWGDKELLEAISGIKKQEPDEPVEFVKSEAKKPVVPKAPEPAAEPARPKATRTRGGAAVAGARRGGRA